MAIRRADQIGSLDRSWVGAWLASGGYDTIAAQVFAPHADLLLLEYDTVADRAWGGVVVA
jgi:hypothetical protein